MNSKVADIIDERHQTIVVTANNEQHYFDYVVICTGHHWAMKHETTVPGYFDSPYPPNKLRKRFDHTVVVRGSSLTAIDAIKTAALSNGKFTRISDNFIYERNPESPNFAIELHSRDGLLPSVRVHMEEPHVDSKSLVDEKAIESNRVANDGFVTLDFLFEEAFKRPLESSSPKFFNSIKNLTLEEFVEKMMTYREEIPAFELMKIEYAQSLKSIRDEKSVPWKEMLASLSFATNYPAKYLCAEDMLRLRLHLLPLISVVIAFVPQSSCETLLALHDAGCLTLITDGHGGDVHVTDDAEIIYRIKDAKTAGVSEQKCETFIDCIGQRHFEIEDFPFKSLINSHTICGARLRFRSPAAALKHKEENKKDLEFDGTSYYLKVPGVMINDHFQVISLAGEANPQIYLMAVPHIGGFNPDYSGLDFCEQASSRVVQAIQSNIVTSTV